MAEPSESHEAPNTRPFWVDPVIAGVLFAQGLNLVFSQQHFFGLPSWIFGWPFIAVGVGWLWYHRREAAPAMKMAGGRLDAWLLAVLVVATILTGYDIYDRHERHCTGMLEHTERAPSANDPAISITSEPDPNSLKNGHPYCLRFYFMNSSNTVTAHIGNWSGYPDVNSILPSSPTLDITFDAVEISALLPPNSQIDAGPDLPPNSGPKYSTVCVDDDMYEIAVKHQSHIIFMGRLLWRDNAMKDDEVGIVEVCGYVDPGSTEFHDCPTHNRSFILKR